MAYPSPSNSTRELTCSGLHRLGLAVFMNTPGTYRLFLIKDIKAARATKHLFPTLPLHVFAAVFKEPSEDGDTSHAATGIIVHVSL